MNNSKLSYFLQNLLDGYSEKTLRSYIFFFIFIAFTLLLAILFTTIKDLFSSSFIDESLLDSYTDKVKTYVHSQTLGCREGKYLTIQDIAKKFKFNPDIAIKVFHRLRDDINDFEYENLNNSIRTRCPSFSNYCKIKKYVSDNYEIFFIYAISICLLAALGIYLIIRLIQRAHRKFLARKVLLSIIAMKNRSVQPHQVRQQMPNLNEKEWNSLCNEIESNKIVHVYNKTYGKVWEIN